MDRGNRTNQCNPSHIPSGLGHNTGYAGTGTKSDLGNHANQGNPNNQAYHSSRGGNKK
uniref:Uncharacterized protein n=1 Tax=Tetranychus urticae TaxID=32264 RepID=T1L0S9_TETUR